MKVGIVTILITSAWMAACTGSTQKAPNDAVTVNRREHPELGDAPTATPKGANNGGAAFRGGQDH